ncbi:VIT1/CCC1 transporter family protein [Curtobacterium flaccumfaciens]|nr:VIT1/CCC1 transporter family protein [Curtobacterium flaccumfaciens]
MFGANDGLVSNLALIIGISASGADWHFVLLSGIAGLLAGALSMGAGSTSPSGRSGNCSRRPRRTPKPAGRCRTSTSTRTGSPWSTARRMSEAEATQHAAQVLSGIGERRPATGPTPVADDHEAVGTGLSAAVSSFCFFASGAVIPVLPFLFGMQGWAAIAVAGGLVGIALLGTGAVVGVLSGASPGKRAFRQLAIGFSAAIVTYALALLFGTGSA